jgi:hypothetical protein
MLGWKVVQKHMQTRNTQLTRQELISEDYDIAETNNNDHATHFESQDAHGIVPPRKTICSSLNLYAEIITSKYNASTMISAVNYIADFEMLVLTYNSQQCDEQCNFKE